MAASNFREFVERKSSKAPEIDWAAKRDVWLGRLEDLYRQVEGYLGEFTGQGLIDIGRYPVSLHEEYIGDYSADALRIQIGTSIVTMKPIGTLLIGSAGRVDMEGPSGTARIVLAPREVEQPGFRIITDGKNEAGQSPTPEPDWTWKIVVQQPRMRYVTVDEQSFRDALMAVADA